MNALKHGLLAKTILLEHEDPAEWEALCEAMFVRFDPADVIEEELVGRVASLFWRMRRIPIFEAALMETVGCEARKIDQIGGPKYEPGDPATSTRALGVMVERLLRQDLTSKLTRYEAGLQRQLKLTLDELYKVQRERLAREETETALVQVERAVEVQDVLMLDTIDDAEALENDVAGTA